MLSGQAQQNLDLSDKKRLAIHLKNTIGKQLRETGAPAESYLALLPSLSSDQIFGLPANVSIFAAVSIGKIICKKTSDA